MAIKSSFTIQTAFVTNKDRNASLGVRSLFCSADPNPLTLWERNVPTGRLRAVKDSSIQCNVIEITAADNEEHANYIKTPIYPFDNLSIRQPIFVMVVKNIHRWFTFEMTIVDTSRTSRKLRCSTTERELRIHDQETILPLLFTDGWNQVQIDLNDFTRRCFDTNYIETKSIKVASNCALHRVYFCENTNRNQPHKFSKSSPLSAEVDTSPGACGDGFDTFI